jgi:hypothetical protein
VFSAGAPQGANAAAEIRPASGGPAHRQPVDAQRRLADAHRHALAFLAAGADARIEAMSLPIIETRVSASGPLPISVAPFTGG